MKKYAKIAAVCAATLLAFLFFGCSDDSDGDGGDTSTSSSSTSTSGSLAAPSGADPFTTGTYKASADNGGNIDIMFSEDGVKYNGDVWEIDKTNRTITLYGSSGKLDESASEVTYTYNETEKTVTIKLSKVAVPQDVKAYIAALLSTTSNYEGGWKLGSQSEVIEYAKAREESDSDKFAPGELVKEYEGDFAATVTYKYEKSGDDITLTLSEKVDGSTEKITLSPQP